MLCVHASHICLSLNFSTVKDQKEKWRMCGEVSFCSYSVSSSTSHSAPCRISVQHRRIWAGDIQYVLQNLLTYRFTTDLSAISVILTTVNVLSAVAWHYSQYLKQATVKLISQTQCKSESYYGNLITENMFCAGSPDWSTDACKVSEEIKCMITVCVRKRKIKKPRGLLVCKQ